MKSMVTLATCIITGLIQFISFASFSQRVTGTVYGNDNGRLQTLPGVNIYWENTRRGTTSDEKGAYTISGKTRNANLVFSFVGYETKTVRIGQGDSVDVILDPNLTIGEVLVTEKNRGTYLSAIDPVQTERITGAELFKAACCNLAESFETNPSVDVSYNDAITGAKQIRLLGLDGIYTQLQTDNIPNFRGLATPYGLTFIPGPWMESIQVSKGNASVVNGYESITGQINVADKKPDSTEKLHLNGFSSADGKLEFNANGNIRVYKDQLATGIFFHAEDFSNRIDHNHDGFLDHPLNKQYHLYNVWKYNNRKGLMIHGALRMLSDDRAGGQTGMIRSIPADEQTYYKTEINNDLAEGMFKIGYVWPSGHTAVALLSNFVSHDLESFYGRIPFDAGEKRAYMNLVVTRDLDASAHHVLNTGASYFLDRFDESLSGTQMHHSESVPGIFAEYTFKPSEKLTLMTGIRSDFHNLSGTLITPRAHIRYQPDPRFTFRGSVGKGYRTANVLAENSFLLSNYRQLAFDPVVEEEAWNYGLSLVQNYNLSDHNLQISAEYYRTSFVKHLQVDKETSADVILLRQSDETSFANSFQIDARLRLLRNLDITVAYRRNDVRETIGGRLLEKIYTSRYKGLASLNYTTKLKKWMFDYTAQFNGGGRLPQVPEQGVHSHENSMPRFPAYTVMNAQITRFFRSWSIYIGSENFTDFMQKNPVLGADNPFAKGFDATNIWGPVMGRRTYAGIRYTLNYDN